MRISDWISDVCSSDLGRAGGSLYNSDDSPLVLLREESTGKAREQDNRQADQRDEYGEPAQRPRQYPSDAALITISRTSKPVVESSKKATGSSREPILLAMVFGYVRLEKSRTQRGSERPRRSDELTSELQSLMRISFAVFCLKKYIHHKHTSALDQS